MEKFKKLSRAEMKNVTGGRTEPADCSATCGDGSSVSCSGSGCTAIDSNKGVAGSCTGGGTTNNCKS